MSRRRVLCVIACVVVASFSIGCSRTAKPLGSGNGGAYVGPDPIRSVDETEKLVTFDVPRSIYQTFLWLTPERMSQLIPNFAECADSTSEICKVIQEYPEDVLQQSRSFLILHRRGFIQFFDDYFSGKPNAFQFDFKDASEMQGRPAGVEADEKGNIIFPPRIGVDLKAFSYQELSSIFRILAHEAGHPVTNITAAAVEATLTMIGRLLFVIHEENLKEGRTSGSHLYPDGLFQFEGKLYRGDSTKRSYCLEHRLIGADEEVSYPTQLPEDAKLTGDCLIPTGIFRNDLKESDVFFSHLESNTYCRFTREGYEAQVLDRTHYVEAVYQKIPSSMAFTGECQFRAGRLMNANGGIWTVIDERFACVFRDPQHLDSSVGALIRAGREVREEAKLPTHLQFVGICPGDFPQGHFKFQGVTYQGNAKEKSYCQEQRTLESGEYVIPVSDLPEGIQYAGDCLALSGFFKDKDADTGYGLFFADAQNKTYCYFENAQRWIDQSGDVTLRVRRSYPTVPRMMQFTGNCNLPAYSVFTVTNNSGVYNRIADRFYCAYMNPRHIIESTPQNYNSTSYSTFPNLEYIGACPGLPRP